MKKIDIKNIKVIQAPLAGISDIVFRQLIRRYGGKCLLTTEMLSSEALSNVPNPQIARFEEFEYPLSFQLVGHKPRLMAKAAKLFNDRASAIDLNFGCPVNKVVKSGDGSAMMRTPELAAEIVRAVKDVTDVPLSAKFRLGWEQSDKNFVEFALKLEEAGVDFITVHARTRSQMYAGEADWGELSKLKGVLKIPYFANGDIKSVEDALKCLEVTGASGVSIGRGLMGDFTLAARLDYYFEKGAILPEPDLKERIDMLKEHLREEVNLRGENNGVKFMRKFYNFYISSVRNASKYRQVLVRLEDLKEIEEVLDDILGLHPAHS